MNAKKVGRLYRALFDLSLSEMAKSLGVTSSMLSNYESGRTYSSRLDKAYESMASEVKDQVFSLVLK